MLHKFKAIFKIVSGFEKGKIGWFSVKTGGKKHHDRTFLCFLPKSYMEKLIFLRASLVWKNTTVTAF
jgi:hypothetical protein